MFPEDDGVIVNYLSCGNCAVGYDAFRMGCLCNAEDSYQGN
jgi:hypothetical protein